MDSASASASRRWSHIRPSRPSTRRNLAPGRIPWLSRVSLGITIRPALSIVTTAVMVCAIYAIGCIIWYRCHSRKHARRTTAAIDPKDVAHVAAALSVPCDGIWSDAPHFQRQGLLRVRTAKERVSDLRSDGLAASGDPT